MELGKCMHGNGPECERCKAMDIPEVEEMEVTITELRAEVERLRAQTKAALLNAKQSQDGWNEALNERNALQSTAAGLRRAVADRYQKADDAAVQLLEKAKLTLEVPAAEYVPAISDAWQLIENALEKIR